MLNFKDNAFSRACSRLPDCAAVQSAFSETGRNSTMLN